MKVIGISLGHDSNATLVEDGRIVRYAAEERFNRIKVGVNSASESFRYVLGGYKPEEIDAIVVSNGLVGTVRNHFNATFHAKTFAGIDLALRKRNWEIPNIKELEHHDCHAASSYYTSGLDNALIVTIDGMGDQISHMVCVGEGAKMRPMSYVKRDGVYIRGKDGVFSVRKFSKETIFSWGWYYGMVTEALGWRMCCDEGKTMGLAPYGDPKIVPVNDLKRYMYKLKQDGFYHNNGQVWYHFGGAEDYALLVEKYGGPDFAAAGQKLLEDKVLVYIKKWLKRTGQRNLCVAGGLFQNVKLNQRIAEECDLDSFWPFPLSSDVGVSIGAALLEYHKRNEYKPKRITHLYYGPEYDNQYVKSILDRNKLHHKPFNLDYVAQALKDNKIVAWFQGRMEGGPRALGGRSILMSPLSAENKDTINSHVKFREGFRPFCPSVTAERATSYFDLKPSTDYSFMITACKVFGNDIPAVTHVDKTARPQVVRQEDNPKFHALLTKFGQLTGHPVLLNTSFNIMGQPIIMTVDDAIRCFYGVGLDMLVLGDYILEK